MIRNSRKTFDFLFIGSGISSTLTLINFLEKLSSAAVAHQKMSIALVEKYDQFFTGIPYGERSGVSVHLITSLENFLPETQLIQFKNWLSENKQWLLQKFAEDGGKLAKKWLTANNEKLRTNDWNTLFIPRAFFGYYVTESVENLIEKLSATKKIDFFKYIFEVNSIEKLGDAYFVQSDSPHCPGLSASKVIFSPGSLPFQKLWKDELVVTKENLLFVNDPYKEGLNNTLDKIHTFLLKKKAGKSNILIVGANASALEMLYKINDQIVNDEVGNFTFLSSLGLMPDGEKDDEKLRLFSPKHLIELKPKETLTAAQIAEAVLKDLDEADRIQLGPASTVGVISKTFGALLPKLDADELYKFACKYGNEIGRRQRCAGAHYLNVPTSLALQSKFEHIAGRFSTVQKIENDYFVSYLDTATQKINVSDKPFDVIINCVGSINFESDALPALYKQLIASEICVPNCSKVGFHVNQNLEAAPHFYIIGPLLAGNVINGQAVWHVEHCGRIIKYAEVLADNLIASLPLKTERTGKLLI